MLSGEIGRSPPIETFLADTKTCGDIMRGFRVSAAETPIVAAGRSVFRSHIAVLCACAHTILCQSEAHCCGIRLFLRFFV